MSTLAQLITAQVRQSPAHRPLAEALAQQQPGARLTATGLRGGLLAAWVAALAEGESRAPRTLLVTANAERSGELADDLEFFLGPGVLHFPKTQVLPYDAEEAPLEEQIQHLDFLYEFTLAGGAPGAPRVGVTSIEALQKRLPPLAVLHAMTDVVRFAEPLEPQKFAVRAAELGYERVGMVEARGQFAVRGGIIDIFPPSLESPVRIDLFGDDIESMRPFDIATQRSRKGADDLESLRLLPASMRCLYEMWRGAAEREVLPLLLDLLPPETLLVLDGVETFPLLAERYLQIAERRYAEPPHDDDLAPREEPPVHYASLEAIETAAARFRQVHHSLTTPRGSAARAAYEGHSFETAKPSLEQYVTEMRRYLTDGYLVVVACDNEGQAQRFDEVLREHEMSALVLKSPQDAVRTVLPCPDILITTGPLHQGFRFAGASLFVVTDREIFGRYKRRPVLKKVYKGGGVIADPREIRQGDYVVHLEHGIGRFAGIRTQRVDGRESDFLELHYAEDNKLLVPVEKIAYVQKFSGADATAPALDKLGSGKWVQRRKKSSEEIERLAAELLSLYAKRAAAEGYAYGPDNAMMREFEASFLYTETPDQYRAIEAVKADLVADRPMDRLVCGDVGYGKTEVAIRAAFKAVLEGRQVALLCPTTILAQQHFRNFAERFADYPFRVEMLSRFRTEAEVRQVLAGVKAGTVHLVIGTHMLLSKRVVFADLGLVIVDEEQRFGVSHKERLKEMRASVDFLTLTATPIPRTLYMALSGLRDMSLIHTPPADRHPIKTRVIHWNREQLEEAILRELNRGGQVFFVHNRVSNIHQIAERVQELAPGARIAIGHGQMDEHTLEQVMLDFIDRKFDILVSTTIIESGLDIPNVNTIIVNRADMFGLAQLYQLRGRVGRESRRAYAYLIVPQGEGITEQAVARLAAIQEFTELGVGFQIAMRDLEIRGTGNLLGKEQHGTVNAIGFELYCDLLADAVTRLKGETSLRELREVELAWKTTAFVPPEYVPAEPQRVMIYKKISEARSMEDLLEIEHEVRDRYGEVPDDASEGARTGREDLPWAVRNLLDAARVRLLGARIDLRKVTLTNKGFKLHREDAVKVLGPLARPLISGGVPKVYTDDPDALEFVWPEWPKRGDLARAVAVLERMAPAAD